MQIPGFAQKLRHLYARTGLNLAGLAKRLKRTAGTVSGWVHGSRTNEPETVSAKGFEALAHLLAQEIGVSIEDARRLWRGPVKAFANALAAEAQPTFEQFLQSARRAPILSFLKAGLDEARLVTFYEHGEAALKCNIGEVFAFALAGPPQAQIVLTVETNVGVHLGVPGPGAPARLDAAGRARLPITPGVYRFDAPGGPHTFTVLLVEKPEPLSIAKFAGQAIPLDASDLAILAREISELAQSDWCFDRLTVDVR